MRVLWCSWSQTLRPWNVSASLLTRSTTRCGGWSWIGSAAILPSVWRRTLWWWAMRTTFSLSSSSTGWSTKLTWKRIARILGLHLLTNNSSRVLFRSWGAFISPLIGLPGLCAGRPLRVAKARLWRTMLTSPTRYHRKDQIRRAHLIA